MATSIRNYTAKFLYGALALFVMAGCAHSRVNNPYFSYRYRDDAANKSFALVLTNLSDRPLCISPDLWPNESGIIPVSSAKIFVEVGEKKFPLQTSNDDWSNGIVSVSPGKTLTGRLDYKSFSLPSSVREEAKILHLVPIANPCRPRCMPIPTNRL